MALHYIDNLDARLEMFSAGYTTAKPLADASSIGCARCREIWSNRWRNFSQTHLLCRNPINCCNADDYLSQKPARND